MKPQISLSFAHKKVQKNPKTDRTNTAPKIRLPNGPGLGAELEVVRVTFDVDASVSGRGCFFSLFVHPGCKPSQILALWARICSLGHGKVEICDRHQCKTLVCTSKR